MEPCRAGPSKYPDNRNHESTTNSTDQKTAASTTTETKWTFESLLDETSSEEEPEPRYGTDHRTNTVKTSDEKTSSSQTDIRHQVGSLKSGNSSEDEINVGVGLPQSLTTTAGTKRRNDICQVQSSNESIDGDEIVLSMVYQNGHLGAAYYNTVTSELYVLEDIAESNSNFDITNVVYRQARPTFIITSSGMGEQFITLIKKLIVSEIDYFVPESPPSSDNRCTQLRFKVMSKKEYSFASCNTRVKHLKLETEPEDLNDDDRVLFLNSIINFNRTIMIHALGLLLKYLDKNWNAMALEAVGQAKFMQLHKMNLRDVVMVDNETYKGLQIVNPRYHPSLFKYGNVKSCKEGFSLYSLLNRCYSRPGVQCLWSMFQHPTNNVQIINERLDVIEFCLDPKNLNIVQNLTPCLSKIYQITKVMNRLSAPQAKASEWQRLQRTLSNILHIVDICESRKDALPIFTKIVDSATVEMHHLRYFIEYIVDFEGSRQQNKFMVKSGVDSELDELNHRNQTLPQVLSLMAEQELQDLPESVKACSMVYLPDIGYLLAITRLEGTPSEDWELPGLEFKFVANNIGHYKSPGAIELQNTFGDILEKITKRQSQIMLQLVQYITKHIKPVLEIIKHIAKLDALISLSQVARDLNYVRPNISKTKKICIKQGRHPLLEITNTVSISNDTFSGDGKALVKIITAPNASGKSVYLKQVALIVFMAHIGSYVPAESADVGVVTHILSRIHFADTMAMNASSFMIDLRQMNKAVSDTSPNSLIVIDEFGKGTSHPDALSLFSAYLTHFINKGSNCPHILVSTHLHGVVDFIPKTPIVEEQTFEFVILDDKAVVFLYRLVNGNSGISFAHSVAGTSAGLEHEIVQRALSLYEAGKKDKRIDKLCSLTVCQRAEMSEKIRVQLVKHKRNIDINGLTSCITRMWSYISRNKSTDGDTTTS